MATPRRRLAPNRRPKPGARPRRGRRLRRRSACASTAHRADARDGPRPVAPSEARFPEWAIAATRLTDSYLDSVSGAGDGMVAAAPRVLRRAGPVPRPHPVAGRPDGGEAALRPALARAALRGAGGATRTACNAATATCIVRDHLRFPGRQPGPRRSLAGRFRTEPHHQLRRASPAHRGRIEPCSAPLWPWHR